MPLTSASVRWVSSCRRVQLGKDATQQSGPVREREWISSIRLLQLRDQRSSVGIVEFNGNHLQKNQSAGCGVGLSQMPGERSTPRHRSSGSSRLSRLAGPNGKWGSNGQEGSVLTGYFTGALQPAVYPKSPVANQSISTPSRSAIGVEKVKRIRRS